MIGRSALKIFLLIVGGYGLLWLPGLFWSGYSETPMGLVSVVPFLSIYLFHRLGIPGLLQNNGLCGWGWCSPTVPGWLFLIVFWLVVAWFIARGLSKIGNP